MRQLNPGRGRSAKTGRDDFPVVAVANVAISPPLSEVNLRRVRCCSSISPPRSGRSLEKQKPSGLRAGAHAIVWGAAVKMLVSGPRPVKSASKSTMLGIVVVPSDSQRRLFRLGVLRGAGSSQAARDRDWHQRRTHSAAGHGTKRGSLKQTDAPLGAFRFWSGRCQRIAGFVAGARRPLYRTSNAHLATHLGGRIAGGPGQVFNFDDQLRFQPMDAAQHQRRSESAYQSSGIVSSGSATEN